jgi:hypothetical protein
MGHHFLARFYLSYQLVIDVSKGTISSHCKKRESLAHRVKPHIYYGWIVYSILIVALLTLVLRVLYCMEFNTKLL